MFAKLIQNYKEHLLEYWALAIVLCIAGALRLNKLPEYITWNGDTARDMLVARHLSLYDEPLQLGHSAYGLRINSEKNGTDPYGMSHYPSYYFRVMAMAWSVAGNPLNLSILIVFYQLAGLLVLYLGLRQVFGALPSWCAVVTIALSMVGIEHSLAVAIHPSVPLFFLVLTLFITGFKRKQLLWWAAAAVVSVLACLIHYSFLVCFVWILGWSGAWLLKEKRVRDAIVFVLCVGLVGVGLFFALHQEVIRFYGLWPFIGTFTNQYQSSVPTLYQAQRQIGSLILFRLEGIFYAWRTILMALTIGLTGVALSVRKEIRVALGGLIIFALLLVMMVATKSTDTFHNEQVLFFDYILLMVIGISCGVIFEQPGKETKAAIVVIGAVLLTSITGLWYRQPPYVFTLPIAAAQSQAQELLEKSPYPVEETEYYVSSYYSWDYETPTVLFWMEALSGKKLVKLVEAYNNIGWEGQPKTHMIVSCQRFPRWPAMELNSCQTFLEHFKLTGKYELEKELFSNQNYRVFLYKIH